MKYIKFTGDYSQLKNMGYEFQKLFAGNYMQWSKGYTRIWKKGGDVSIDRLTNYEGAFFEWFKRYYDKQVPLPTTKHGFIRVQLDMQTGEVNLNVTKYVEQNKAMMTDDSVEYRYELTVLSVKNLSPLLELVKLGWVELGEYDEN